MRCSKNSNLEFKFKLVYKKIMFSTSKMTGYSCGKVNSKGMINQRFRKNDSGQSSFRD